MNTIFPIVTKTVGRLSLSADGNFGESHRRRKARHGDAICGIRRLRYPGRLLARLPGNHPGSIDIKDAGSVGREGRANREGCGTGRQDRLGQRSIIRIASRERLVRFASVNVDTYRHFGGSAGRGLRLQAPQAIVVGGNDPTPSPSQRV